MTVATFLIIFYNSFICKMETIICALHASHCCFEESNEIMNMEVVWKVWSSLPMWGVNNNNDLVERMRNGQSEGKGSSLCCPPCTFLGDFWISSLSSLLAFYFPSLKYEHNVCSLTRISVLFQVRWNMWKWFMNDKIFKCYLLLLWP